MIKMTYNRYKFFNINFDVNALKSDSHFPQKLFYLLQ